MFVIDDEFEEISVKGTTYKIKIPSMGEVVALQEAVVAAKEDVAATSAMTEFMEKLGLPKDVAMGIPAMKFIALVQHIQGVKKN